MGGTYKLVIESNQSFHLVILESQSQLQTKEATFSLVDEKSKCYGTKGRFIRDNLYNSAHTMESDYTQVWDMPSYQYLTRHYIKISNWILFSRKK